MIMLGRFLGLRAWQVMASTLSVLAAEWLARPSTLTGT